MKCSRIVVLFSFAGAWGLAQNAPSFEVASIKPNRSGDHKIGIEMQPGGRFVGTNVTVGQLITFAYDIKDNQISGAPSWVDSDHFDIAAKPDEKATADQVKLMMETLLADRFKLKFKKETKEMPILVLTVAKNGPKLEEFKPPAGGAPPEGGRGGRGGRMMMKGRGELETEGTSIAAFATMLSRMTGRTVLDKTGLTGSYNFKLKWTPDEGQGGFFRGAGDPGGPPPPPSDANGPSLFSAVQEQLGLKLEAQKGPVDLYVIQSVEKPTEN